MKYFCASLLILLSGVMHAQEQPCVILDVDYEVYVSESSKLAGQAVITFQDTAFNMSGNGIEAYCDGTSLWTLDSVAKEVYIESVTEETEAYLRELSAKLSGYKADAVATIKSPEGQSVHIKVNSIKKSAGKDVSSFRPTQNFDSDWVVTDLR